MTRGGRITLWTVGALMLVMVGGVWLMLSAIDRRIGAPCLDQVAEAPDGEFYELGETADGNVLVRYDGGLELTVPSGAQRIVSALPGITEMLCHLGAEDRIVAVSPYCDFPASVKGKQQVSVQPFDAEAVLAVRPDLLVADRRLHRRDLSVLKRRVPNILLLDTSRSLPHLAASMKLLAHVVGGEDAAMKAAEFHNGVSGITTRLGVGEQRETPLRVLVVAQWDPLYVLGRGSLIDDLLRICGCVNVACDLKSDASGTFSEELVIARKPDVILTPREPLPERLAKRWRSVPAVKHGRFVDGSADDLVRAGPRILGALDRLAKALREAR